jgi:hypothetical protein
VRASLHGRACAALAVIIGLGTAGCTDSPPDPPRPTGRADDATRHEGSIASKANKDEGVAESAAGASAEPPAVRFVDVAEAAGLSVVTWCGGVEKSHILESVGSGCAWIDFDADGLLDIFIVNAWALDDNPRQVREKGRCALYRNLGQGRFEDVSQSAGIVADDWGCGVCAADYDNDGHVDLYVTNFGESRLYRNRGNGTFEELATPAGVTAPGWSTGAAFFDADGDGWLDLYVAQYIDCTFDEVLSARRSYVWRNTIQVMPGPFGLRGGRDRFFHNNRDGTFSDATDVAGMTDIAESYGLGVLASDLDGDGDADVYVANDSNANFLYRNDGQGVFTEIGGWSGAGVSDAGRAQGSMGVDAADLDGDGLPEMCVTNFAHDFTTLYRNEGQLLFRDESSARRMREFTYVPVSWGCAFLDCDLDAKLDLLILNGHIYPQVDAAPELGETYKQLPTLLLDVEGGVREVSREAGPGLQIAASMRGLAVGDYDDDGRPDLLITAMDSRPLLLRNETRTDSHWCKLRLLNRHGSPAIGAVAKLVAGGVVQWREVRSGSTYCSQNSFDLHFGLGAANRIESLEVRWPGGARTMQEGSPADRTLVIRQPAESR